MYFIPYLFSYHLLYEDFSFYVGFFAPYLGVTWSPRASLCGWSMVKPQWSDFWRHSILLESCLARLPGVTARQSVQADVRCLPLWHAYKAGQQLQVHPWMFVLV